jgi:hypothetical protein
MENNILHCKLCNYNTNNNTSWLTHVKSQKHKQNGKKIPNKCNLCNYTSLTHWHLKMHNFSIHCTKEERSQQKYYCNVCDSVFFSLLYLDKHLNGKSHKIQIEVNKTLEDMENKFIDLNK